MLFNSLQFLIFFPTVTAIYFLLPHRHRQFMLLVASCIFYMAFIPVYIFVLFATIIVDYFAGMLMETASGKKRKIYLVVSVCFTCSILFVFKYFNFFNSNFSQIARLFHWNYSLAALKLILPIGLSFHTFQSLSYVIEVYRGNQKAEKDFKIYALYVMFYPQLVAGPIERPYNLLHQFYEKHYFEYQRVTNGLKLMAWGMFKKVVIADRLAMIVNKVYNNPHDYQGVALIAATVFFAYQIYCDFSGYSDIAIGAAQVMGFRLMDNFNRPYFSRSISEFWKRWHISLASWFRDYLYIPLGGNRVTLRRWCYNIFITFFISGLWHGANWTFLIWGGMNGLYMILGHLTRDLRHKFTHLIGIVRLPVFHNYIRVLLTFSFVCCGWVFFRANNLSDAFYIYSNSFLNTGHYFFGVFSNLFSSDISHYVWQPFLPVAAKDVFIKSFIAIVFLEIVHLVQRHGSIRQMLLGRSVWIRWPIYYSMVFGILLWGVFNETKFIYFQF